MTSDKILSKYYKEVKEELNSILQYWINNAIDKEHGGFYGKIDSDNYIHLNAPKGAVLNARILWTFSAAYNLTSEISYLKIAERTYGYIRNYFIDKELQGIYWTVDYKGYPLDTKKQIYAQAFLLFAFSEYYKCNHNEDVLDFSKSVYDLIERYGYDDKKNGYWEAFSKEWKELDDVRLSEKDANEKKTMNTNLHVLEAYTTLYQVWPSVELKKNIINLLEVFLIHIINDKTNHVNLYFDEDWKSTKDIISYGHDIEAGWLINEAAVTMAEKEWITKAEETALQLSFAAREGLDKDGGLWYEKEKDHWIKQKHWWPQAEAMVGFFNCWQITGDIKFLDHSLNSWKFIKDKIIDYKNGEWFWGIDENDVPMQNEDKIGLWKCPYHNGRACIEIMKRITNISSQHLQDK